MDSFNSNDMVWVIVCTGLVFVMQAGFCCLESGFVRSKNSINVAIKNLADFCLCAVLFWVIGYSLMFGESFRGFLGTSGHFLIGRDQPWDLTFFLFQMVFCATAATIVSGAVAERMRFSSYLVVAALISTLIYPVIGHWVWGGAESGAQTGWLAQLGFIDFAGSTVVHSVGGWVALAAVLVVGPRAGRFGASGIAIRGYNLPFATLGALLLWFGWFGFNGGSTLGVTDQLPVILVNTILAGGAGGVTGLFLSWSMIRRADVGHTINGSLAGLVGITASCHIMTPFTAILIGVVAGILSVVCKLLLERFKIDDAIGAIPVHCCAGVWGTLAVAVFGNLEGLGIEVNRWSQFWVQAIGVGATGAWAFGVGFGALLLVNRIYPMRVSAEVERMGLNVAEHGARTDILDLVEKMENQAKSRDFSTRVSVDQESDVQSIAVQYNRVLDNMNRHADLAKRMAEVVKQSQAETEAVNERLHLRVSELNEFNELAEGRELRMIELKHDVNVLSRELGRPAPFDLTGIEEETTDSEAA